MDMTREDGVGDTRMTRYAGMENIHSTKHTTAILLETCLFYKKYVRERVRFACVKFIGFESRTETCLDGFFEIAFPGQRPSIRVDEPQGIVAPNFDVKQTDFRQALPHPAHIPSHGLQSA